MFTSASKSSIVSSLLGASADSGGVMGAIQSVFGNLESEKLAEIKAGVELLLAQVNENTKEDESQSFFQHGWRPFLCWGICIIVLTHFGFAEFFNIKQSIINGGLLASLDSATLFFLGSILGIYMTAKTVEHVNSNNLAADDSN